MFCILPTRRCSAAKFLITSTLLFSLAGCVNQDDAAGLSKLSDEARAALPRVSNDVEGTCLRQNTLLDNTPANELPASVKPLDCAPYHELAAQLGRDQKILLDYFNALGKLASNKPMGYGAAVDANVTEIGANSSLSASAAAAGKDSEGLLKSLADAATHGYREKQLNQLLHDNDLAVQSLTQALKKVITADYGLRLSNEESTLDNFYQGPMAAAKPNERLTLILVQRQYAQDKTGLQRRRAAATSYGRLMDDLGVLHAKLTHQAGQKASLAEIGKQIAPTVESLKNVVADLQSR
jgi:hypothetical protein